MPPEVLAQSVGAKHLILEFWHGPRCVKLCKLPIERMVEAAALKVCSCHSSLHISKATCMCRIGKHYAPCTLCEAVIRVLWRVLQKRVQQVGSERVPLTDLRLDLPTAPGVCCTLPLSRGSALPATGPSLRPATLSRCVLHSATQPQVSMACIMSGVCLPRIPKKRGTSICHCCFPVPGFPCMPNANMIRIATERAGKDASEQHDVNIAGDHFPDSILPPNEDKFAGVACRQVCGFP